MRQPQPPAGHRPKSGTPVKEPMKNPPHMGGFIRREIIEEFDLSVTEAAGILDVGRVTLSRFLNEKTALTWDMAIKIEKAFGPKADHLMRMQNSYDAAQARKRQHQITVNRVFKPSDDRAT